ncbi:MAG: flagellar hook assembly protein FlgD [Candidatus Schekmanbacteria bacterium]|nr:MAG: flagellar hook assembly protein FlgD [Candidatus Schekmanbacteria bacterium]
MNISDLQMTLSRLSQSSNNNSTANGIEKSLGRDAFLKMLLAQIQYQNPLEPMENTEFTAQLAQFSSLEQLSSLNKEFTSLSNAIESQKNIILSNLVGREVEVIGNEIKVSNGEIPSISFDLKEDAKKVEITISKKNGPVVRRLTLGNTAAGKHSIQWDGKNMDNQSVDDGAYTFMVSAYDQNNNLISTSPIISGSVDGVRFKDGVPYIEISGLEISPENILKVK